MATLGDQEDQEDQGGQGDHEVDPTLDQQVEKEVVDEILEVEQEWDAVRVWIQHSTGKVG